MQSSTTARMRTQDAHAATIDELVGNEVERPAVVRPALYLAVFDVQILIRLPTVLKSRVFGILRLAGDRKCNKPEPARGKKKPSSAFALSKSRRSPQWTAKLSQNS